MLENKIFPTSFEWWGINISFGFMLICLIGIKIFLYRKSNKHKEGKTIMTYLKILLAYHIIRLICLNTI